MLDSLSKMLEEYKDLLAAVAGIATMSQMLSGLFICKDIYQAKSTKNIPSTPFVGGVVISILFMQHGILLKDNAMGIVNFIGIAINVGYVAFYFLWSGRGERAVVGKELAVGTAVIAVLLGYVRFADESTVAVVFGSIVTVLLFVLISMPLFSIKKIIRTKNADMIPFPMVVSGLVVGVLWTLYGIAAHQTFIVFQNLFFMSLSFPQLVLCLMYPSQKNRTANQEKKTT